MAMARVKGVVHNWVRCFYACNQSRYHPPNYQSLRITIPFEERSLPTQTHGRVKRLVGWFCHHLVMILSSKPSHFEHYRGFPLIFPGSSGDLAQPLGISRGSLDFASEASTDDLEGPMLSATWLRAFLWLLLESGKYDVICCYNDIHVDVSFCDSESRRKIL